ncbi:MULTISPECIES: zinc ribbon domain-containing protein [unclassified Streptomyces]|uniref:zinc ribbon domain-containing protein n=1 Tax=unclassified Streptomyces TaxID=2593676 RepID=UPI003869C533
MSGFREGAGPFRGTFRGPFRGPLRGQRARHCPWRSHRPEGHVRQTARRAGAAVAGVDAHGTSHVCPGCGHTAGNSRTDRDAVLCRRRCGLAGRAGRVAGVGVRGRARSAWVLVNGPGPQGTRHLPELVDATRDRPVRRGGRERDAA